MCLCVWTEGVRAEIYRDASPQATAVLLTVFRFNQEGGILAEVSQLGIRYSFTFFSQNLKCEAVKEHIEINHCNHFWKERHLKMFHLNFLNDEIQWIV